MKMYLFCLLFFFTTSYIQCDNGSNSNHYESINENVISLADDIAMLIVNSKEEDIEVKKEVKKARILNLLKKLLNIAIVTTKTLLEKKQTRSIDFQAMTVDEQLDIVAELILKRIDELDELENS